MYDRGRGRREEKEEGCQAGSSTTPGRRSTRGTAQQDSPTAERVASIERRRIATREPVEGRTSTRTRARTRENGREGGTSGRSGDRGHFHRGRPSEGPPPSIETARLLPSEPRTRTALSPPPTSDEAPGGMAPLQRNIPPSVTPVPSLSSLVPQSWSLEEEMATASTSSPAASRPSEASPPATLEGTTETVALHHTPAVEGVGLAQPPPR